MKNKTLVNLAEQYGWKLHDIQKNIGMISFVKIIGNDPARINIYTTKMTVATCINHPRKGKTQLFRKKVSIELMAKIFENPRTHTHIGYRKK